jgi:hypothetical protein
VSRWKHTEPVMLYAQPTCADLVVRIDVAKMLHAGETPDACVKYVDQYTKPRAREIETSLRHAREAEDDRALRQAVSETYALTELRGWLLQPVIEHVMLCPQPVFISRSEWEAWQKRAKESEG